MKDIDMTEGLSVPDALRAIATWKEQGQIQERYVNDPLKNWRDYEGNVFSVRNCVYRPKPWKPRVYSIFAEDGSIINFHEGTPEVLAALKAAGIEI